MDKSTTSPSLWIIELLKPLRRLLTPSHRPYRSGMHTEQMKLELQPTRESRHGRHVQSHHREDPFAGGATSNSPQYVIGIRQLGEKLVIMATVRYIDRQAPSLR